MSESGITPLAQRLAEENNVDWRSLKGSGENGRIVERDVLEYLARVMAGEEAVNPTAEPLPEGMEAWPDADGLAADRLQPAASASSAPDWSAPAADPDPLDWPTGEDALDLGTPVAFDAEEAELRATGEFPAPAGDLFSDDFGTDGDDDDFDLSDDIFLFDDEVEDGPGTPNDAPEPAVFLDTDEEDRFAAVDELEAEPVEGLLGRADDLLADDEFEDADLTDLAQLDGELDSPELADDLLRPFEAGFDRDSLEQQSGAWGDYASDQPFGSAEELAPAAEGDSFEIDFGDLDELPDDETGLTAPAAQDDADDWPAPADVADDLWSGGDAEPASPVWADADDDGEDELFSGDSRGVWQEGVDLAADIDTVSDEDEAEALARRIEAAFDSVADARPEFENFGDDDPAYPEEEPEDEAADVGLDWLTAEAEADRLAEVAAAAASEADREPFPAPDSEPEPVVAAAAVPAPAAASLPLADFGNLLRRRLDVSPLTQAQNLVGSEISGGEGISATAFLLRAARRAAAETELFPGSDLSVAAAVIVGNRIELVEDGRGGFRSLAQELQQVAAGRMQGTAERGSIQLAVADMSGFEVDEAILDLGVPMLSLGRSLHDEGTGTFRSTLTLSGHFDLQQGARFLQVASELLANPLRLLL